MKKHLNIIVKGNVQGVFFRKNTKQKAEDLGINGFVRNEPNGTVYIEAEGEENNLKKFIKWCKEGPELANVRDINIKTKEEKTKNYSNFEIKY